jgi:hypothetical protein
MEFVGTCMTYLHANFHMPDLNGSIVIANHPEN